MKIFRFFCFKQKFYREKDSVATVNRTSQVQGICEAIEFLKTKQMKGKTIQIFACSQCPYYIFDDNMIEERYGKPWCNKIDKEVPQDSISEKCPLTSLAVNIIHYVKE